MINTAILGKYRIQEFIQFTSNILMIVKQHGPDKLKIRSIYLPLVQNYERLQETYKRDTTNGLTPQITRLDDRRDRAIVCLRSIAEGYTYHFDEKLKAAGQLIVDCIDKYGSKLYQLNYNAETAALKNLGHDLHTDAACKAAIEELHLEWVVKEMDVANNRFEKLFVQRLGAFSQDEAKTTKEWVQRTTDAYRTLMQHIDAHATLAPSKEFTSLINHINENIEHFNVIVERRKGGAEEPEAESNAPNVLDTPA